MGSLGLFQSNFRADNTVTLSAKFRFAQAYVRSFQQAALGYTEDRFAAYAQGSVQVDVRGPHATLRLRVRPTKFLAHLDLGRYLVSRPLALPDMALQPYLFLAASRLLNHHLCSLGAFLALSRDTYSHLRVSVVGREGASEVYAQHNFVRAWPGLTLNHLLYFRAFSSESQLGNTLSLLGNYRRAQFRAELSAQRQDKLGRGSSEARLSLGYFLADNCLVGINHARDLLAWTQLTEVGLAYSPDGSAQFKAKLDSNRNLSAFVKYRWGEALGLTVGLSGSLDQQTKVGRRGELPFGFSVGLRFKQ